MMMPAMLGLGGGALLGGIVGHEIAEDQQDAYQDGYQDGQQDDYGGGGGDFGGGDDFGGGGDVSTSAGAIVDKTLTDSEHLTLSSISVLRRGSLSHCASPPRRCFDIRYGVYKYPILCLLQTIYRGVLRRPDER